MITLLGGENSFEIDQTLGRIIADFDGTPERVDGSELSIKQLPDLFMGATLFAPQRLVIIRDLSSNKPLWSELEDWLERASDDTHIVLIEPKPDKRTRTYKWIQKNGDVRDHPQPREQALVQWVQATGRELKINLEAGAASFLIAHAGTDQWHLYHELQKLSLTGKPVSMQLIREIVAESGEASVFGVLDDAFAGKSNSLAGHLSTLRLHEEPYRFFGLLSNQVCVLALASESGNLSSAEFAKAAGVHPFVAGKSLTLARRLGAERVRGIVAHIAKLDIDLKSLGGDPWVLIESALRTIK